MNRPVGAEEKTPAANMTVVWTLLSSRRTPPRSGGPAACRNRGAHCVRCLVPQRVPRRDYRRGKIGAGDDTIVASGVGPWNADGRKGIEPRRATRHARPMRPCVETCRLPRAMPLTLGRLGTRAHSPTPRRRIRCPYCSRSMSTAASRRASRFSSAVSSSPTSSNNSGCLSLPDMSRSVSL